MFDKHTMRALALASQLGFSIACPLLACGGGGFWLARQWGIGPWLGFLGLLIGLAAAAFSIYELAVALPARRAKQPTAKPPPDQEGEDN